MIDQIMSYVIPDGNFNCYGNLNIVKNIFYILISENEDIIHEVLNQAISKILEIDKEELTSEFSISWDSNLGGKKIDQY